MTLARISNIVFNHERLVAIQVKYKTEYDGEVVGAMLYFDTGQEIFVGGQDIKQSVDDYFASTAYSLGMTQTTSSTGK